MSATKTKAPAGEGTEEGEGGAGDSGARGDGARGGDAPVTRADVEGIVESLVPRIVDELLGGDDGDQGDSGDGGEGDGGGGAPNAPANVETSIAAAVANELGRIRTAEQTAALADEVKELREKVEKAPVKLRRVTRAVWGGEE